MSVPTSAEVGSGRCPDTLPPFEKGGRKLSIRFATAPLVCSGASQTAIETRMTWGKVELFRSLIRMKYVLTIRIQPERFLIAPFGLYGIPESLQVRERNFLIRLPVRASCARCAPEML